METQAVEPSVDVHSPDALMKEAERLVREGVTIEQLEDAMARTVEKAMRMMSPESKNDVVSRLVNHRAASDVDPVVHEIRHCVVMALCHY